MPWKKKAVSMNRQFECIYPDWRVPARVHACVTTRLGGVSKPPFDSMNLATHVGDDLQAVEQNRQLLRQQLQLPQEPRWLEQVHGVQVADGDCLSQCQADAFYTDRSDVVGVVLTADCLPVFIANSCGSEVAVAHAGWKGLLQGVVEHTVKRFLSTPAELRVWLGPAIGPEVFEVGEEVRQGFIEEAGQDKAAVSACFKSKENGKWLADIYALARYRLKRLGISRVSGGDFCTVSDQHMFYSYRRDGKTGRMASLIWITEKGDKNE